METSGSEDRSQTRLGKKRSIRSVVGKTKRSFRKNLSVYREFVNLLAVWCEMGIDCHISSLENNQGDDGI